MVREMRKDEETLVLGLLGFINETFINEGFLSVYGMGLRAPSYLVQ